MLSTKPVDCPVSLLKKARSVPPVPTAIVNAGSRRALESARLAYGHNLIVPLLVGDQSTIRNLCGEIGWDVANLQVEHTGSAEQAAEVAVALAREGRVGALMKGHLHTGTLMRAVLNREKGLRTEHCLSHVFHMTLPGGDMPLCITDAAINVLPNIEQKLHIARNAIELLHALGNSNPKVALLSGSEVVTPSMPSSVEAAEIAKRASSIGWDDAIVDGPLAFDLAVSPQAAAAKGITSPVAGEADVILVPNLETGNALFKLMVHFMSATAAGIVLGAKVPLVLTSRADPAAAGLASAALAAIVSQPMSA